MTFEGQLMIVPSCVKDYFDHAEDLLPGYTHFLAAAGTLSVIGGFVSNAVGIPWITALILLPSLALFGLYFWWDEISEVFIDD